MPRTFARPYSYMGESPCETTRTRQPAKSSFHISPSGTDYHRLPLTCCRTPDIANRNDSPMRQRKRMLLPEPRVRASLSVSVRPAALPLGTSVSKRSSPALCRVSRASKRAPRALRVRSTAIMLAGTGSGAVAESQFPLRSGSTLVSHSYGPHDAREQAIFYVRLCFSPFAGRCRGVQLQVHLQV
jgi:hypothetical protein